MFIFICKIIIGLVFFYFLPGYLFIKIFIKENDSSVLEKLTFALLISPVILIAPFCLITSFAKLSLNHILLLMLLEVIILAVINIKNHERFTISNIRVDKPDRIFILGFIIFISLNLTVQLISTRMQWSYHGTDHGGIVYQILNDIIPPTNPMIYGYPITTYWMYHLKLAMLSKFLNITPLQASVLNNIYALVATLLTLYCVSGYVISQRYLRSLLPFFIFSVSNMLGPFYLIVRILSKGEPYLYPPIFIVKKILGSADPDSLFRLFHFGVRSLFYKFLNFNGAPDGLLYACTSLLSAILILNRKKNDYFILLFISLLGALMFHAVSSFGSILFITALFSCILFTKTYDGNEKKNMILKLALGGVLALLIGFPYLFSASHYLAGKKISLTHSLNNIKNLLIFYWFSLPFYIYGMIILFKRRRLDLGFLSLSSVFIILAYSFLEIGYRTHYKLLHFLAIPYGIILLLLIEEIIKGLDKKIFAYSLISLVIMFSVSAPMAASYIYLNKDWASNKEYISKGINVELRSGASDLAKTYRWIRSNTNERSVLIAPGRIYYETILELLSQRRAYVADGGEYTAENKHFYKRKDEIKKLFTPQRMKIDVLKELQSIRDDAYIVLSKEDNPAYFNLLRNEFLQLNKYLKSVFRTPTIEIYKVIKPID